MPRLAGSENSATTELISDAVTILEAEHPMTIRQLFYRLVSVGKIENSRSDYQRVSRIMTKARDDSRCQYGWIVDRSRPVYKPNVWEDPAQYAEVVKTSYRKDYWTDQPEHAELWSEKDSVIGSIGDLTDELGITVRVGRGFMSTTRLHEITSALYRIKKPISIFFVGDFDPSGVEIEKEFMDRVYDHMWKLWRYDEKLSKQQRTNVHAFVANRAMNTERLAIHKEDIELFDLPPLRVKTDEGGQYRDSRAKKFVEKHGDECVELDALPPTELRRRIREAVEERLDLDKWNRAIAVEKVELDNIVETVGRWRIGETS
jgi:hypothetical protein